MATVRMQPLHFVPLLVLLLFGVQRTASLSAGPPAGQLVSPCPAIFKYEMDVAKRQLYGFVDTRQQTLDKVGNLEVHLSVGAALKTKYFGSIETLEDRVQIQEQFSKGRGVTYRVNFPIQDPLPKLTKLVFNGRELCSGPADRGGVVSSVTLRHFLRSDACVDQCNGTPVLPQNISLDLEAPGVPDSIKAYEPNPGSPGVQHEYQRTVETKEETTNPLDNSSSVKYVKEEITYRKQIITPIA